MSQDMNKVIMNLEEALNILRGGQKKEVSTAEGSELVHCNRLTSVSNFENFLIGEEALNQANVGYIDIVFRADILNKFAESDVCDGQVVVYSLDEDLDGLSIVAKLGKKFVRTKAAHFFELIRRQSRRQCGILDTDGNLNIAFVEINRMTQVIHARWHVGRSYWNVGVRPIGSSEKFLVETRIVVPITSIS